MRYSAIICLLALANCDMVRRYTGAFVQVTWHEMPGKTMPYQITVLAENQAERWPMLRI